MGCVKKTPIYHLHRQEQSKLISKHFYTKLRKFKSNLQSYTDLINTIPECRMKEINYTRFGEDQIHNWKETEVLKIKNTKKICKASTSLK